MLGLKNYKPNPTESLDKFIAETKKIVRTPTKRKPIKSVATENKTYRK